MFSHRCGAADRPRQRSVSSAWAAGRSTFTITSASSVRSSSLRSRALVVGAVHTCSRSLPSVTLHAIWRISGRLFDVVRAGRVVFVSWCHERARAGDSHSTVTPALSRRAT